MLFSRALHFVLSSLHTNLKQIYFLVRGHSTVGIRENSMKDTAVPEPSGSPEIFCSSWNVFAHIATYCWHVLNTIRITSNSDKISKALWYVIWGLQGAEFWDVKPCCLADKNTHLRRTCCCPYACKLERESKFTEETRIVCFTAKMEAARPSETLVSVSQKRLILTSVGVFIVLPPVRWTPVL